MSYLDYVVCVHTHTGATQYNTWQHTATHGNTRQHTATHGNTLQHAATHGNTLQRVLSVSRLCLVCFISYLYTLIQVQRTTTHGNTLQRTETHWNTLQHTATHCNTLQHTATYCNTQQHTTTCLICITLMSYMLYLLSVYTHTGATHNNTRQHTAARCNTRRHTATHCNTLQHTATHCNTLQRTATHYKVSDLYHTYALSVLFFICTHSYRVPTTHRMPHLHRSFPAKEPYN